MNTANTSTIIEQYIGGEFSIKKTNWVENEINTNPQFSNEYKLHLEVHKAIKEKDIMDLREKLQTICKQGEYREMGIIRRIFSINDYIKPAIAAAVLTVMVIASILLFSTGKNYTNDQLFTMNYESIPAISNSRSANSNSDQFINKAFQLYEQKDFNGAINIFKNYESDKFAQFFLGMSYIEIDQYQNASVVFLNILDKKNNLFTEESNWYLGLCYLKLSQTQKAKEIFNKIANSNNINNVKANKILKSL
ncbi:MAG: tetratricopeptide repeat protein [Bacteroidales bacterium]|nr:tetratricopeptide repeat protein [Bacteroidales bacterium]